MQSVKSVVIVGGGSAGWLAALALHTYCPFLRISLIRPRDNTPIGVGESTQTDFLRLLRAARIDVQDFYRATEATVKCGIYYRDWNRVGQHYWHPFSSMALSGSYTAAHYYQQMISRGADGFTHDQYYAAVHSSWETCALKKQVAPESAVALHVDARKITQYLENFLSDVEVIESGNLEIENNETAITSLKVDGRDVSADLYVDCTGFARALHSRIGSQQTIPYVANVNRAVAAQVPYGDIQRELTPYTQAHAHEHGWTWAIPLQSRIGSGYVYHGDFCSPEQAEASFREYWGVERMKNVAVNHIQFHSNSLRNPWQGNVVTIGLSAGFVEPLEATGLNWTITAAEILCQALSVRYYDEDTSIKYNANMLGYITDIHDFIDTHYLLSARRDSEFWRFQSARELPRRLKLRLDLYAEEMPSDANRLKTSPWAFNEISWLDILNAYDFKYRSLQINPMQENMAREALSGVPGQRGRGIPPQSCQPDKTGQFRPSS